MMSLSEPSLLITDEDAARRRQRVEARHRRYAQRKRRVRLLRDGTIAAIISAAAYGALTIWFVDTKTHWDRQSPTIPQALLRP